MATYCFLKDKQALFIEAAARGCLSGILDFPHLKSEEVALHSSEAVPDELSPEVCCIPGDDSAYHKLVASAWYTFYLCIARRTTEREISKFKVALKALPRDEALHMIRAGIASMAGGAYHRFQEALAT